MKWECLTPVGHPVDWRQAELPALEFPGYGSVWVNSGTGALAFTLQHLRMRYPEVDYPEVIVPGYCCPDLLAASLFAGFKPVVVDIGRNDPGYDLNALENALTAKTLAVIAVNFLGIRERLEAIAAVTARHGEVALIEDNAQWFPVEVDARSLIGDYATFSFGRGKPISLLGGGLVAVRDQETGLQPLPQGKNGYLWPIKAWLLNWLTKPRAYFWMTRLPMLNIGRTAFKPLDKLSAMPRRPRLAFPVNYKRYRQLPRHAERFYDRLFEALGWGQLDCEPGRRGQLLRYPVLCRSRDHRDRLLLELSRQGLGASAMYGAELSKIAGVDELKEVRYQDDLANSAHFAERFLTLPTHNAVSEAYLRQIAAIFRSLEP